MCSMRRSSSGGRRWSARRRDRARPVAAAFAFHARARARRSAGLQGRRRARRRHRQAPRRALRAGRAGHAEGEAAADRRLRGRRLPLLQATSALVGSLLLGLYDDEGKLDHVGFTRRSPTSSARALTKRLESSRAARLHRRRARRPEPVEHGAQRRMGAAAPRARRRGPLRPRHRRAASGTARSSCAGGPTRRREQCTFEQMRAGGAAAKARSPTILER